MSPEEFLEKVVCPQCKSKIDKKVPFNTGYVCDCRLSKDMVVKPSYNNPGDDVNHTFKLHLTNELMIVVQTYGDKRMSPYFYLAGQDRPFFPLYDEKEIPDYIFIPLKQLIAKMETLATFS